MIKKMKLKAQQCATGKNVVIWCILTNLIYSIMIWITIPAVMQFSNGMDLPDMMPFGYDSDYISNLFHSLGEKGRFAYMNYQLPVDFIYPGMFAFSYGLLMVYCLVKWQKLNTWLICLSLVPLVAGIFDYAENSMLIWMLNDYPAISVWKVKMASLFTILKSTLTTLFFLSLVVLLIAHLTKKWLKHIRKADQI